MSRALIYHTQLNVDGLAKVVDKDGHEIVSQLDTISKSGIVLHCDQESLSTLFPKTPSLSPKQAVQFTTTFGLPEVGKIEAKCDVISLRRLSRDTFELQLNFVNASPRALYAIEHYVERKLRKDTAKPSETLKNADFMHLVANQQNGQQLQRVA